ncbi:hypothetical protein F5884DRAFT_905724 [Xylogone sp. PMI_703]|nr:hypothetical protein F5884DRAFT_905724 [Xylogone sp. PMI_703]
MDTNWPAADDPNSEQVRDDKTLINGYRQLLLQNPTLPGVSEITKADRRQFRLLRKIKINPSDIIKGSPWDGYRSLDDLKGGGESIAAYTRETPVRMVTIKKYSLNDIRECRTRHSFQHSNLLSFVELYQFEKALFGVADYVVTTLARVIAARPRLEEQQISSTCRQIFEGMLYLSRRCIFYSDIDRSKVLFTPNGCVKIAQFEGAQAMESTIARILGQIALEMMEKKASLEIDINFALQHPELRSNNVQKFLEITLLHNATSVVIKESKFLEYVSPAVMIPVIEHVSRQTSECLHINL